MLNLPSLPCPVLSKTETPGALRGAINKDTRDKKASVWDAVQTIHNLGQNSYTVLELDAAFDTVWDSAWERSQSSANSAAFLTRLRRKTSTENSAH